MFQAFADETSFKFGILAADQHISLEQLSVEQ